MTSTPFPFFLPTSGSEWGHDDRRGEVGSIPAPQEFVVEMDSPGFFDSTVSRGGKPRFFFLQDSKYWW